MSKLFELKNWMSIKDAAVYLGRVLKEDVTESDILQLALDGHLRLSVDLVNHAKARLGARFPIDEAELNVFPAIRLGSKVDNQKRAEALERLRSQLSENATTFEKMVFIERNKQLFESGELVSFFSGTELPDGTVITFSEDIVTISGIWDLPMVASEQNDIRGRLQQLMDGPPAELTHLDGTFLVGQDGVTYASLQDLIDSDRPRTRAQGMPRSYNDPGDFYPISKLPDDANVVVRVENIKRFLQSLEGEEKALDERERTTLLNVIGALAEASDLDLSQHIKAGNIVAAMLERKGISISGRTIGEHLKSVREAMESRKVR